MYSVYSVYDVEVMYHHIRVYADVNVTTNFAVYYHFRDSHDATASVNAPMMKVVYHRGYREVAVTANASLTIVVHLFPVQWNCKYHRRILPTQIL